jgi:casein kinase II subunit beta
MAVGGWIQKFLKLSCNEYLVEVPVAFITEPLLRVWLIEDTHRPFPKEGFKLLCHDTNQSGNRVAIIEETAQIFYYLSHARYITTKEGMRAMKRKYDFELFGTCPRVHCENQPLLPVGLHDSPAKSYMKCFCPKCRDIYRPPPGSPALDGAAFGTSFPHLFLQNYLEICPHKPQNSYIPRISGFKIHKDAPELKHYHNTSNTR